MSLAILWLILKIIQKQLYVYRKSQCIITKIPRLVENMGIINNCMDLRYLQMAEIKGKM